MTENVNPTVLETILTHLALLFLTAAAGDPAAARTAAAQALAAYHAQTEEELRLASEILSFSLHALEALGQAADSDLSLSRILRLRGSAVSLSREAHKAQRKLDQLQRARTAATQPQPQAQPQPPEPRAEPPTAQPAVSDDVARALAEAERIAKQMMGKHGGMTWTQAYQKRMLTKRMAENAKKNQAKHASQLAPSVPEIAPATD